MSSIRFDQKGATYDQNGRLIKVTSQVRTSNQTRIPNYARSTARVKREPSVTTSPEVLDIISIATEQVMNVSRKWV
jgi:hypothetical protein